MPIEPGNIYVAVPNYHLLVEHGRMRLGRGPRENMARPAIDPLFRSAAVSYGPRVIGIVLSGLLNDGAAGLEAIKRCGGVALVQDPYEAIADEMPRNALNAIEADLSLPSDKIGDVLSDLVREAPGPSLPVPAELRLEVAIAAGDRIGSDVIRQIGNPAALTCPECQGVLSTVEGSKPLRFRCQVGHALTAEALAAEQESTVDEAMRVALRIIDERAELVRRMAEDARASGRRSVAEMYDERMREYRQSAETIRKALLRWVAPLPRQQPGNDQET